MLEPTTAHFSAEQAPKAMFLESYAPKQTARYAPVLVATAPAVRAPSLLPPSFYASAATAPVPAIMRPKASHRTETPTFLRGGYVGARLGPSPSLSGPAGAPLYSYVTAVPAPQVQRWITGSGDNLGRTGRSLMAPVAPLDSHMESAQSRLNSHSNRLKHLEAEMASAHAEKAQATQEAEGKLRMELQSAKDTIRGHEVALESEKQTVSQLWAQLGATEASKQNFTDETKRLNGQIIELKKSKAAEDQIRTELRTELQRCKDELKRSEALRVKSDEEVLTLQAHIQQLTQRLQDLDYFVQQERDSQMSYEEHEQLIRAYPAQDVTALKFDLALARDEIGCLRKQLASRGGC